MLEGHYGQMESSDALLKVKNKAWDHFLELGLPTRKSEVFRYIKVRSLFSHSYVVSKEMPVTDEEIEAHLFPECKNSALVFVNGHFQPKLSRLSALPKRSVILPLNDAIKTYGAFLNNQWAKSLKEETDSFAALNAALHRNGAFVYLPPKTIIETPVQILNIIKTGGEPMLIMPRLHLFSGSQSQIDLHSTQAILNGGGYCFNMAADFSIEDESHVRYTQTVLNVPSDVWHFDALRANLKRNSTLKSIQVTDGCATVRNDYRVALAGENAEALLNGVWMLAEKRESHTHVLMDHQAPNCRSMQLFKGVLNDVSQSSFEGKILVRQPAQKTEAFQLNHNLLLNDKANAQSKPNLEIFADDVKASHGATMGQLDREQLFYMKTRGFEDADAKNMLVYGFCKEVIDMIPLPSLLQKITASAQLYIEHG